MRVRSLEIKNFRGVSAGTVELAGHTLLVGGNNIGKSTVCEALDLILGPERLFRRPVVDEHDFHRGRYQQEDKTPIEICIRAVLTDLSPEAQNRFFNHLRRWSDVTGDFVDVEQDGPIPADAETTTWALPLVFFGRYSEADDDFVGNTFFDHPIGDPGDDEEVETALGGGRRPFSRDQKRLCGFVFLRALRTGSRALSLQRGSLLDTVLRLGGGTLAEMWEETLSALTNMSPAIGDIAQLRAIREQIGERMEAFVRLSDVGPRSTFFASDLTREHLREVVRVFIAAYPDKHLLPYQRLGTGAINLLVFALLTFIAELKGPGSVIFALEEPEIALPPHTQRRVTDFVLTQMGQAIITSHSPYVIEQFEPAQIVILNRDSSGQLKGTPVTLPGVKPKMWKQERRQFAEAILSYGVLVVEGATEASMLSIASTVVERSMPAGTYRHIDLAGLSVFDSRGNGGVPKLGPMFVALGKRCFALYDKPLKPLTAEATSQLAAYEIAVQSPHEGVEQMVAVETGISALRRFMAEVQDRPDFPAGTPKVIETSPESDVRVAVRATLEKRKGEGYGYAAIAIRQCESDVELPKTLRQLLLDIHVALEPSTGAPPSEPGPLLASAAAAA